MKKVILTLIVCAAALSGTAAAEDITVEQARSIALAQAGGNGIVTETDIDRRRNGGVVYEFEIRTDDDEFEIEIDGATGEVTEFSRERLRRPPAATTRLTAEEAQKLAVEKAGGGSVSRYRLERDDGRLVHEITVLKDGERYRLEIEDADGSVSELSIRKL